MYTVDNRNDINGMDDNMMNRMSIDSLQAMSGYFLKRGNNRNRNGNGNRKSHDSDDSVDSVDESNDGDNNDNDNENDNENDRDSSVRNGDIAIMDSPIMSPTRLQRK